MKDIQEQFEAWAEKHKLPLHKDGLVVTYAARATDDAWQAWCAALKSIEIELPALKNSSSYYDGGDVYDSAVIACRRAIEAVGLRVKA